MENKVLEKNEDLMLMENERRSRQLIQALLEFENFLLNEDCRPQKDETGEKEKKESNRTPGLISLRKTPHFYPKKDFPLITDIFNRLAEKIKEVSKKTDYKFAEGHLGHILRNSPVNLASLADRLARRIVTEGKEKIDQERENVNTTTERNITKYSKGSIETLEENKNLLDSFLLYLEILSDEEKILKKELEEVNGWKEYISSFYRKGENTERGISALSQAIFFARLEGWETKKSSIKGLEKYKGRITEENFDREFEKVQGKEILDKEKIREHFFKNSPEKQVAA